MVDKFIFDVDGTLTPSRQEIDMDFAVFFTEFCAENDVYLVTGSDREKTIEQASNEAKQLAKEAGAKESSIEINEINENPLAYLPGKSVRLQIKAIGDLENY